MITNKEVYEMGKLVQDYPIDENPFTGEQETNGGVENILIYDNKVFSVLTDFTGSIADPDGEPSIITDDAESFMKDMFYVNEDDLEDITEDQAQQYLQEYEDWQMDQSLDGGDQMRSDDW